MNKWLKIVRDTLCHSLHCLTTVGRVHRRRRRREASSSSSNTFHLPGLAALGLERALLACANETIFLGSLTPKKVDKGPAADAGGLKIAYRAMDHSFRLTRATDLRVARNVLLAKSFLAGWGRRRWDVCEKIF